MATKLRNLRVHEVSLVKRPANQHAEILLSKADDGEGPWEPCADCPSPKTCKANGGCAAEIQRRGRAALEREAGRRSVELKKALAPDARHDARDAAAVERAAALAKSDAHPLLKSAAARAADMLALRCQGRDR